MRINRQIRNGNKKNGHANFLEYFLQKDLLLSLPTIQIKVCTPATKGRTFRTNLKWAYKDNKFELFVLITSNKDRRKSNKNLEAMMGATKA